MQPSPVEELPKTSVKDWKSRPWNQLWSSTLEGLEELSMKSVVLLNTWRPGRAVHEISCVPQHLETWKSRPWNQFWFLNTFSLIFFFLNHPIQPELSYVMMQLSACAGKKCPMFSAYNWSLYVYIYIMWVVCVNDVRDVSRLSYGGPF